MRRFLWIASVAILVVLAGVPAARAERRVALVIGNSAYRHTPQLGNPKHDAADMAAVLRTHGFHVIEGLDLDKAAFDRKVGELVVALKGADAGVFFYAGHGLQVAGQNYLVPIDAKAEEEAALDLEMVRVDTVHRIMERQTETNILFLDACRDNPLARNLARSMGTRSAEIGRGLARVEAGVGTLISFSTQPGNVALDGAGSNSPYAGALVKHLAASKEDLSAILIDVRNDVIRETRNKQVPWEHVALRARFYFGPPVAAGSRPAPQRAEAKRPNDRTGRDPALSVRPGSGESFRDCDVCPEMVVVPPGSVMMGSPPGEEGRKSYEGPQHRVTIARPFAVGKLEVTFAEWDACVAERGCAPIPDGGWGRGRRPVMKVSWDDIATEYLPWLNRKTDKAYRLLTEAEWEYAARAGTTTRFAFGDTIALSQAHFSAPNDAQFYPRNKTVEVGSFRPNPFGLHDMHGNVSEWVQDCFHDGYHDAPSDGSAWTSGDCSLRVTRGGSIGSFSTSIRSAARWRQPPGTRLLAVGLRVTRPLAP